MNHETIRDPVIRRGQYFMPSGEMTRHQAGGDTHLSAQPAKGRGRGTASREHGERCIEDQLPPVCALKPQATRTNLRQVYHLNFRFFSQREIPSASTFLAHAAACVKYKASLQKN